MAVNQDRTERQIKAFTQWINDVVSVRGLEIAEFPEDLKNGVILIHLAEILTGQKVKKFRNNPTLKPHYLDNLQVAFKLLRSAGLRIVNAGMLNDHSSNFCSQSKMIKTVY